MTELIQDLAAAVAREVMGWTEWIDGAPFPGYPLFHVDEDHMGHKLTDWAIEVLDTPEVSWRIWNPLVDMNDVWEMDNENWLWVMREHQMGVDAKLTVINPEGVYWATVEWGEGMTRREAWCISRLRAALMAVRAGE